MNSASDKGKAESGNKRLLKLMNDAVCTGKNRKDKRRRKR